MNKTLYTPYTHTATLECTVISNITHSDTLDCSILVHCQIHIDFLQDVYYPGTMNTVIVWETSPECIYPSTAYKTLACLRVPRLDNLQIDIIKGRIR